MESSKFGESSTTSKQPQSPSCSSSNNGNNNNNDAESNMEERKWDELKRDCLVEILSRVGIESLAESIPFVCKSWYQATLDPGCWTSLVFLESLYSDDFVKFVVGRSQRSATCLVFCPGCPVSDLALSYISEGCPSLKLLYLPYDVIKEKDLYISALIGKWKSLEYIKICDCIYFSKILEAISIHCKNFVGLVSSNSNIGEEEVSLIVEFMPKIKFLRMRSTRLPRMCLLMLLKGCCELEFLDVSNCIGFEEDDEEILKLASHIKNFNCSGAMLYSEDDYDDHVTYRDSVLFDDEYNSD